MFICKIFLVAMNRVQENTCQWKIFALLVYVKLRDKLIDSALFAAVDFSVSSTFQHRNYTNCAVTRSLNWKPIIPDNY